MGVTSRPLRPYQWEYVRALRSALRGVRIVLAVAPTGSGKTRIIAELASRATARGLRVLVLAHREELLRQARTSLKLEGLEAGIVAPWAAATPGPVQIASVQTLLARGEFPPADLVIPDEAHHYVAERWTTVLEAYPAARIVGFTATPQRTDGTAMGNLFEVIVSVVQARDLIASGFLVPPLVLGPPRPVEKGLAAPVVRTYLEHAKGLRAVVFCANVAHALEVSERLKASGVRAASVDGTTPSSVRVDVLERFASGELEVLSNVHVLTEGFDLPDLRCVVFARGFTSVGSYVQAGGRVLRSAPGKSHGLILDLRGVTHVHGLLDDPRVFTLDGRGMKRLEALDPVRQCKRCGAVFASSSRECPRCGAPVPRPETPEECEARLERIRATATLEDKRSYLDRVRSVANSKGRAAGWVAHVFRGRFGHWPNDPALWR